MPQAEPHRTRIAAARFAAQRERDLSDPSDVSALKWARLTADGGRGMSQAALAVLSGCSRDAVSRAERRDPRVTDATLRRVCGVLGVPVAEARR